MKIQIIFDDIPTEGNLGGLLTTDKLMYLELGNSVDGAKLRLDNLRLDSQTVSGFNVWGQKEVVLEFQQINGKSSKR